MRLVEQWDGVERGLDPRWTEVSLTLRIRDDDARRRAAALLGPAAPGFAETSLRFSASRRGDGVGPEAVRRMLRRVDAAGIVGTLEEVGVSAAPAAPAARRPTLAADWDAAAASLPSDWSDLLCELDLASSDDVERAALLLAPLNPLQPGGRPGFRFRCASSFGYGASAGMARRCLERLDADGVRGSVRIVRALSDTHPVATQGPVWMLEGRAT